MCKFAHPVSLSNKRVQSGLTLIELMVTLVILSILAAAALPYAEVTVKRDKELELRRALRTVRLAIDEFHADWKAGRIPGSSDEVSEDGYPKTLQVLKDGVDLSTVSGKRRIYLRRIPRNPFAGLEQTGDDQWLLRSYQDDADASSWGGQDVFDLRFDTDKKALDGTDYASW